MSNIRESKLTRLGVYIFPSVLIGVGCYTISQCPSYGIGTVLKPGAGFWPLLMGILLSFCGGLLIVDSVKAHFAETGHMNRKELLIIGSITISLLLWGIVSEYLGWLFSTCALALVVSKLFGLIGIVRPLCQSILLTAFCYILFGILFTIDLPPALPQYILK
jgi:hypothetical protein